MWCTAVVTNCSLSLSLCYKLLMLVLSVVTCHLYLRWPKSVCAIHGAPCQFAPAVNAVVSYVRMWWFDYFTLSTCWRNFPVKLSVSLCLPQYPSPPSLPTSLSQSLFLSLSLSLSLSLFLALYLSLSPPPLSLSVCLSLSPSLFSLFLSFSLSLRLRSLSLFFFRAPTNSLSITGGRPMRLERACM